MERITTAAMQSVLLLLLSALTIDASSATAASTTSPTTPTATPTALHQWPTEYRSTLLQKINRLQVQLNEFDQSNDPHRAKNNINNVWVDDHAPLFNEQPEHTVAPQQIMSFLTNPTTTGDDDLSSTSTEPPMQLGEEEELTHSQRKTLMVIALIVVSAIVFISISFEKFQEWAEEHVIDVLKPILATIFGELTILGFIGLIMFMVTKYGKPGLDILACQDVEGWWGKNEQVCPHSNTTGKWEIGIPVPENPLIELTETAHMILFFVMMLFLFESFVLIERAMSHIAQWKKFEDMTITVTMNKALKEQHDAKIRFDKESYCTRKCGYYFMCCPCFRGCHHDNSHENRKEFSVKTEYLRYSALRTAFIKGYNKHAQELGNDDHKLPSDFDFAEYSVKVLADKLTEIVELSTGNWLVIWFVFGCFLIADLIDLITNSETMLLTASSILACYLCCGVISMFQNKADHISHHLIHPLHLHHGHDIRGKAETIRSKFTGLCVACVWLVCGLCVACVGLVWGLCGACVWLIETETRAIFLNTPCFNIFLFPN